MKNTNPAIKVLAIILAAFIVLTVFSAIISAALGVFGLFSFIDKDIEYVTTSGDVTYSEGEIDNLNLKISAINLHIQTHDASGVRVVTTNVPETLVQKVSSNELVISDSGNYKFHPFINPPQKIEIYLPANLVLGNVNIEIGAANVNVTDLKAKNLKTNIGAGNGVLKNIYVEKDVDFKVGAGKLSVKILAADTIDLKCGAGNANFSDLTVNLSGDFNIGAGNLEIVDGQLNNLDVDNSVGRTVINSMLLGDTTLSNGVGNMTISISDQTMDEFKSIKSNNKITVNGKLYDNTNISSTTGTHTISVRSGIGNTSIDFN